MGCHRNEVGGWDTGLRPGPGRLHWRALACRRVLAPVVWQRGRPSPQCHMRDETPSGSSRVPSLLHCPSAQRQALLSHLWHDGVRLGLLLHHIRHLTVRSAASHDFPEGRNPCCWRGWFAVWGIVRRPTTARRKSSSRGTLVRLEWRCRRR